MKIILLFALYNVFFLTNLYGQSFIISADYSGQLNKEKYSSFSSYYFAGGYMFRNIHLQTGPFLNYHKSRLTDIDSKLANQNYEGFSFGAQIKYYPLQFFNSVNLFAGLRIGYEINNAYGYNGYGHGEIGVSHAIVNNVQNTFYVEPSAGIIFAFNEVFNLNFEILYLIKNAEFDYTYSYYEDGVLKKEERLKEKLNLNSILWSAGIRIDFY